MHIGNQIFTVTTFASLRIGVGTGTVFPRPENTIRTTDYLLLDVVDDYIV